jgi:YfiH family protein
MLTVKKPVQPQQEPSYLTPEWTIPSHVHAAMTLRHNGDSMGIYASLNPALHVGDAPNKVHANRTRIKILLDLPSDPVWLNQTHSATVIQANNLKSIPDVDASFTEKSNTVCAILTADCLPLLLCTKNGDKIAAIHAGWRGLLAGIIGNTLQKMQTIDVSVWLGAAIGPCCFEVGAEVHQLFTRKHPQFQTAFTPISTQKYLTDIYQLAKIDLALKGITNIQGGGFCTVCDAQRFYSYRRDQQTGRMATLIWKD